MIESELLIKAKLAEHAERYDDMKEFMKELAIKKNMLTLEELELFNIAYERSICRLRTIRLYTEEQANCLNDPEAKSYSNEIKQLIIKQCEEAIKLVRCLSQNTADKTSLAYYKKIEADCKYYQTKYDLVQNEEVGSLYGQATDLASFLEPNHFLRLSIALNYANYVKDFSRSKAIKIINSAINDCLVQSAEPLEDDVNAFNTYGLLKSNLDLYKFEVPISH